MKTYQWSPFGSSAFQAKRLAPAAFLVVLALFAAGCKKKVVVPPPPPPPASGASAPSEAAPTARPVVAQFIAEPSSIERGQTAQLRWSVSGSTDVSINNGIGTVPASGTRSVRPTENTTYTLTANGPGGPATATASISVTAPAPPPPPPPPAASNKGTLETRVASDLQDALFDYDSNNIRDDARSALNADAEALKRIFADFPGSTINVEGHCDERGSAEYNLGLGDRRASSARDFLVQLGVPADRLRTISYGKERPQCTEANEGCWQKNRRAHFSTTQ